MPSVTASPSATGTATFSEGGTESWSSTGNVTASDNSDATLTLAGTTSTIDSYSTAGGVGFQIGSHTFNRRGQSFAVGEYRRIEQVSVRLWKVGSPTGNAVIKIYAHTGTYGSGTPTGSALATSDNLDVSTIAGSSTQYDIAFSGANQIRLDANTKYFWIVEFTGGDGSNHINIENDGGALGHAGNSVRSTDGTSWSASSPDRDFWFSASGTTFEQSEYLHCSGFGFSIPTNATINGLLVEIEQDRGTATLAKELSVKLKNHAGGLHTTNKATGATLPSGDSYISYGGASDTWGVDWVALTVGAINHADFGVAFAVEAPAGAPTVDHMRLTIYYSIPSGGFFGLM